MDSQQLINYVSQGDFYNTRNLIETKEYNQTELNSIEDYSNNNLLHIAVMQGSLQLVTYFLEKGINYSKENKFKLSPWNLAVAFKNNQILEKFVLHRIRMENNDTIKVAELTRLNNDLKNEKRDLVNIINKTELKNIEMEKKYSLRNRDVFVLQTTNDNLKTQITDLSAENMGLKITNKRIRDEVEEFKVENKKLKTENSTLIEKNEKLKMSVETLMNNSKK